MHFCTPAKKSQNQDIYTTYHHAIQGSFSEIKQVSIINTTTLPAPHVLYESEATTDVSCLVNCNTVCERLF